MKTFRVDLEFVANDECGSIEIVEHNERKTKKAALKLMESLSHKNEYPKYIKERYPEGGRLRVWASCYDEQENDIVEQWSWENGKCVYHTIPN